MHTERIASIWSPELTQTEMARQVGCSVSLVCLYERDKLGLSRMPRTTQEERDLVLELRRQDMSYRRIARRVGWNWHTVMRFLQRAKAEA